MANWYRRDTKDVLARLKTNPERGLSPAEAARRMVTHGPNELVERGLKSPWRIGWEQLTAAMVVVLIVAAAVSVALGDYKDAMAILAIVVLNALLGFRQEYKAEKAMAALKKLTAPIVRVRRDGHVRTVSARDLVPGDVMLLEAGNAVPADARLVESVNLRVQEAALTGESVPVEKITESLAGYDLPVGDRRNMVYMGTVVAYGHGVAVITETGMATELGRIADMIQSVKAEATPLQRRLERFGRRLAVVAVFIVAIVFGLGMVRGESARLLFLTAVSMAVAAVPEGMPAVATIVLALGAQRMLKRRALIRKLPAVEALGSITVIGSDKTGTLTENRMTVTVLEVDGQSLDLAYPPHEAAWATGPFEKSTLSGRAGFSLLLAGGALCNDALLEHDGEASDSFHVVGDPTEGALLVAAARVGLWKAELERALPRVAEAPFASERQCMTTVHRYTDPEFPIAHQPLAELFGFRGWNSPLSFVSFTKGAVDRLLEVCTQEWRGGRVEPLTAEGRERITAGHHRLAQEGLRVLGVAFRTWQSRPSDTRAERLEQNLIFVGMVGMMDPPRPEVREAVATCQTAGIRPVMITGDHPLTAMHIARAIGMAEKGRVLTGRDLDHMSVNELAGVVDEVSVYARVAPEHKLKIIEALKHQGHIVAMTGDGVNDAPALKKADIGVAMGITGTDVAKEAADMILLDDNFATIVASIKEGRVIYANIRKFVKYILSSNTGELAVMLAAPFLGMPLPLLPLQILWINLVTDGLPSLALSLEPAEPDTMQRPPHDPAEGLLSQGMGRDILWMGLLIAWVALGPGFWFWRTGHATWQTWVFTTLTFAQMGNALAVRSERHSLFRIGWLSNKSLLGAVGLTLALQWAVIYVPFLQGYFKTVALSTGELALSLLLSVSVFVSLELGKWGLQQQDQHGPKGRHTPNRRERLYG